MLKATVKTKQGSVTVALFATGNDDFSEILYGGEGPVDEVHRIVSASYGAFGHAIGEVTTILDLYAALKKLEKEENLVLSVSFIGNVLKKIEANVPGDAQT